MFIPNCLTRAGAGTVRSFFDYAGYRLTHLSFADVLDILLLSLLLFLVVAFLLRRRALPVVCGLLVCGCVWLAARVLGLYALGTVLGWFFGVGFVGVFVVFQTEIREALADIGGYFYSNLRGITKDKQSRTEQQDEVLDAVCQAVSDLSRSKTGALIVFERNVPLTDVMRTGVELDAVVTPYLLRNIFFNKAPLHDGAVVIRNRRVAVAGCLLPLSRNGNIDPDLGTRHRSAIGMSESSDALVVVVSEETGIISVAFKSGITRDYSYQSLRALLYKVLLHQSGETDVPQQGEEA